MLKSLKQQILTITSEIAAYSMKDSRVSLLMTMPGLDFFSSMLIVLEIGEIGRFQSSSKLVAWAGSRIQAVRGEHEKIRYHKERI